MEQGDMPNTERERIARIMEENLLIEERYDGQEVVAAITGIAEAADAIIASRPSSEGLREALETAFEQPIHIEPREFVAKMLAGLFGRMPDMSGDQRKRLNSKELRAVEAAADRFMSVFAALASAPPAAKGEKCRGCRGKGYVPGDPEGAPIEGCDDCGGTGRLASPPPSSAGVVRALVEAAEELADLMDDVRTGGYKPDSFTTQPVRLALAALSQAEHAPEGEKGATEAIRDFFKDGRLLPSAPAPSPSAEGAEERRKTAARIIALAGLGTVSGDGRWMPPNESWDPLEWHARVLECVPGDVERRCYETADAIFRALSLIPAGESAPAPELNVPPPPPEPPPPPLPPVPAGWGEPSPQGPDHD